MSASEAPAPSGLIAREMRLGARAGEAPSVLLRRLTRRYALSPKALQHALSDAFGLSLRATLLVATWSRVVPGTVTDDQLDAELGAAVAATRDIWDATGWPFTDPEWTVAASTVRVREGAAPIVSAERHADGSLWFFQDGPPRGTLADVWVAPLWELYRLDPTVGELSDLPAGWAAERDAVGQPWRRRPVVWVCPQAAAEPATAADGRLVGDS